jgi:predicted dinucleotide-binding enzyme
MQIGIIGTGHVGQALATGLSGAGHEVLLGSRSPETTAFEDATVVTQREAADGGRVVVLALPAGSVVDVAGELADVLAGKPVVDATNEVPTPHADRSLGERVADVVPDARVVKAFNTIGANLMTDPVLSGEAATMFLAGDDAAAVETVGSLAVDLGFEPVVAGDLAAASHLENLGRLWVHLSQRHGRDIAFRFLQG